jgi:nitrite reductase/ring-hydroxylating ferredoxin subunit
MCRRISASSSTVDSAEDAFEFAGWQRRAVFNIEGGFCATQAMCTHREGPLSEGSFDGTSVTCPLHGAQFNVWTGAVLRGPAKEPLKTYRVTVDGEIGRVEVQLAHAIQGV